MTTQMIDRRYIVHKELGKGGMGAVYLATDRLSNEQVALKLVLKRPDDLSFASRNDGLDLSLALAQEFKTLATLRHPNIISVLSYGFDALKRPYFTMDYLENAVSPARAVFGKGPIERVQVLIEILQALAYLHRRGIIHRDLKPGNVRVVKGMVKVLDFGLSILSSQAQDGSEYIVGTLEYMPPEILRQGPPSVESDLYAVGVMGYELFTGRYLFDAENTRALVHDIFNKIPDLKAVKHDRIGAVLLRMMAKNPADRYHSAEDAIRALCVAADLPIPEESAAIRESFLQAAELVGRDQELGQLTEVLKLAQKGLGGAVLIGGESGVGKSRLLEEIRIRALVEGFTVLTGAAIGRGRAPYQVWRAAIRSLVIDSDLNPAVLSPLQAIVPDMEALLQAKLPKLEELDPEETQDRIIAAVERLFLAQKKPLLLILEDLHWEGVESYALLGRLVKLAADLPLLILGSYRDDESPHLPDLFPQMGLLRLQRLNDQQIAALSVAMLGDGGRNPQLQDLLQRETEGNVFFLVEIVRALAEEAGDLRHIAAMELPQHVFAGGIIQIIQRRLERVPNRYQPLLRLAAVAGRYLDLRLLQSLAPANSDLQDWLTLCLNAAVLDTQDGQWRFAHDKLREGVLSWLPKDQVGSLHAKVATGIEHLYADTPQYSQYIPALAEHWSVAGVAEKASRFSRLAGSQALESGAYDQAAPLLEAALAYLPDTGESETLKHRAALVRQIGLAYLGMNRAEEAKTRFQQSLKHCQDAGYKWGTAQALSDLGNSLYALRSFKESYGAYLDSLQIAKETRAKDLAPNGIIGVARLLMQAKRYAEATELAAFIEEYASFAKTDRQTVMRAQEVLEQAGQALSPRDFETAKTRGKAKKLTEVMDELLVA